MTFEQKKPVENAVHSVFHKFELLAILFSIRLKMLEIKIAGKQPVELSGSRDCQ